MTARVSLELHQHAETQGDKAAWLLSHDGEDAHAKWVPKSLARKLGDNRFEIDAWKARQSGFLIPRGIGQGSFDL